MKTATAIGIALLLAAGADAHAQARSARDFRWSKALPAGQWVRVHNVSGDVTVTATDGDRVEVVGVRRGGGGYDEDDVRAEVHEGRDGVTICALWGEESWCDDRGLHIESHRDGRRDRGQIDFQVRLPRRLKLSANSVSGDVEVTGVADEVRAGSGSGGRSRVRGRAYGLPVGGDHGERWEPVRARGPLGNPRLRQSAGGTGLNGDPSRSRSGGGEDGRVPAPVVRSARWAGALAPEAAPPPGRDRLAARPFPIGLRRAIGAG